MHNCVLGSPRSGTPAIASGDWARAQTMRKGTSPLYICHISIVGFFFKKIFFEWTIFKVIIELFQYYFCSVFYFVLFWPQGIWNLSPRPEVKPALTALEGKILTTGARGKHLNCFFFNQHTLKLAWVFCFAFHCRCC